MRTIHPPTITKCLAKDVSSVKITFKPDYQRFSLTGMTDDMFCFLKRRCYDIAGSTNEKVKVYFNDTIIPIKSFIDYVKFYYPTGTNILHEKFGDRWNIAVIYDTDPDCKQVSFVNNVSTYVGGTHYNYISDQIVEKVVEKIRNKKTTASLQIKPVTIKNCLTIFINCLINRPKFNSQIKETLNKKVSEFQKGVKKPCEIPDSFIEKICKTGLVDEVVDIAKLKVAREENKQIADMGGNGGGTVIRGIPKLTDALWASTKQSTECTLILTEGDSAKSLVIKGLASIGNRQYGIFPLKGKLLNVREATAKQLIENEEIANIIRIMGLNFKKTYKTDAEYKTLRYGHICIMTDQDYDGFHIKALLMNFIHFYWKRFDGT
jgi:DNA topoisomerase-2